MSDDQFTRLFKYMHTEFGQLRGELHREISRLDAKIDRVYNLLDDDIKRRETDEQERLVMNRQVERHEKWIAGASKHIGFGYER